MTDAWTKALAAREPEAAETIERLEKVQRAADAVWGGAIPRSYVAGGKVVQYIVPAERMLALAAALREAKS